MPATALKRQQGFLRSVSVNKCLINWIPHLSNQTLNYKDFFLLYKSGYLFPGKIHFLISFDLHVDWMTDKPETGLTGRSMFNALNLDALVA